MIVRALVRKPKVAPPRCCCELILHVVLTSTWLLLCRRVVVPFERRRFPAQLLFLDGADEHMTVVVVAFEWHCFPAQLLFLDGADEHMTADARASFRAMLATLREDGVGNYCVITMRLLCDYYVITT